MSETLALSMVTIVRTTEPFDSLAEIESETIKLELVLRKARVSCSRVLVDLRQGPMRNDPAFEHAIARARAVIFGTFARSAVIVSTAVGKLQVMRHARIDGLQHFAAFNDKDEALAYLQET